MNKCAAGIIVFYPNLERLKNNIDAILNQVDVIYCYNNGTNDDEALGKLLSNYSKIRLIGSGKNDGIPFAINQMAHDAIKHKVKWFLTLDQDSICPNDMIQRFLIYENENNLHSGPDGFEKKMFKGSISSHLTPPSIMPFRSMAFLSQ